MTVELEGGRGVVVDPDTSELNHKLLVGFYQKIHSDRNVCKFYNENLKFKKR